MFNEKELEKIHENDKLNIPDWIWNMTAEERDVELERLYKEMKENPIIREKGSLPEGLLKIKF